MPNFYYIVYVEIEKDFWDHTEGYMEAIDADTAHEKVVELYGDDCCIFSLYEAIKN